MTKKIIVKPRTDNITNGSNKQPIITNDYKSFQLFTKNNQSLQTITNSYNKQKGKSIFTRIAEIIIDDIKSVFHMDQKTKENKMRYEAFMEMCKK